MSHDLTEDRFHMNPKKEKLLGRRKYTGHGRVLFLSLSLSYLLQQKRITSLHPLLPTPDSSS